jgi:predicted dehydrogenase
MGVVSRLEPAANRGSILSMTTLTRRAFLKSAALSAAVVDQIGTRGGDSPSPKLRLGLIGCGWYGMVDLEAAFRVGGVEVVALCDVDSDHLDSTAAKVEKLQGARPRTFKDYRQLLDVAGLEAVIIATPPQWHALPFIAAVGKGLDVYCEKPLAYDIREGRAMVEAARKSGRVVQVGFQRRQSPAIQQVKQYLQEGKAGRIIQAEAQIHYTAGIKDTTVQEPPPSLDWDLWCGPAPKLPYCPQIGHMNWRLEKTTGQGHLVDWGIHLIDATRWILAEPAPRTVEAAGGLYFFKNQITTPDILQVQFGFERCPVSWRHRIWGAEEYTPEIANGIMFYGDRETVFVTDDRWVSIPRGKGQQRQVHEAKADLGMLHMKDFIECVRSRRSPLCTIEDGYASTVAVKLAMIAYDTGNRITWDAGSDQLVGNPDAARLLRREYRPPWKHPYAGA